MTQSNKSSYPPGSNRRLIDWVRSPDACIPKCAAIGCGSQVETRQTPEGVYCLECYLELDACSCPHCHKPALNGLESKKRAGFAFLDTCRIHQYTDEKEVVNLQREFLERGQSHSAGYIYPG